MCVCVSGGGAMLREKTRREEEMQGNTETAD